MYFKDRSITIIATRKTNVREIKAYPNPSKALLSMMSIYSVPNNTITESITNGVVLLNHFLIILNNYKKTSGREGNFLSSPFGELEGYEFISLPP